MNQILPFQKAKVQGLMVWSEKLQASIHTGVNQSSNRTVSVIICQPLLPINLNAEELTRAACYSTQYPSALTL